MKRKTGNFGLSLSLDATNSVTFSRPCVAHVEQISSQRVPFHSPPSRFEISTISCLYRQFCFSDPFTAKSYLAVQGSRPLPPAVGVRFDGKLQTFSFFGFLQRQKTISRFVFFSLLPITFQWACLTHWQVVYGISCWKCCVCPFRFQGLLAPTGRRWHLAAVLFLTVLPSSERWTDVMKTSSNVFHSRCVTF